MKYSLGRLVEFDARSRRYPIRTFLENRLPRSYTWRCNTQLDQGNVGACVGFSWAHELAARPSEVIGVTNTIGLNIYRKAQTLDEYPGTNYEGTSVIGGAKAIKTLYPNAMDDYKWIFGIEDLILSLGYAGPVILGVNWYSSMFQTDSTGLIKVSGTLEGGHAILANEISIRRGLVRLHNSWGSSWGINGRCYISLDDLARLLSEQGEGCIPIKRHNFVIA